MKRALEHVRSVRSFVDPRLSSSHSEMALKQLKTEEHWISEAALCLAGLSWLCLVVVLGLRRAWQAILGDFERQLGLPTPSAPWLSEVSEPLGARSPGPTERGSLP